MSPVCVCHRQVPVSLWRTNGELWSLVECDEDREALARTDIFVFALRLQAEEDQEGEEEEEEEEAEEEKEEEQEQEEEEERTARKK